MGDSSSSVGFDMSEHVKDGGITIGHKSTVTPASTSSTSKAKSFDIADMLLDDLVGLEKEDTVTSSVITPYNFLTQSTTIEKRVMDSSATASIIPFNIGLPRPLQHQQQPRKRKPSATVTSSSLLTDDDGLLPTNITIELNPAIVQRSSSIMPSTSTSTVTTVKTERTTVETTTTAKYAEFGIPLDPVVTQPPLMLIYSNKLEQTQQGGGGEVAQGVSAAIPFVPPIQHLNPVFDPWTPPVTVVPPPAVLPAPSANPLADDVSNWIPFPVGKRKRSSGFTPFQLEQLNHQMRMYTLANRLTIITNKNKKPAPPRTRSTTKAALAMDPDEPEWLDRMVTRIRGKGKKKAEVNIVPPPLPPPLPKAQRGRKRGAKIVFPDILDQPPPPGKITHAKKSTGKAGRGLVREVPLVFVECTFCATSVPTLDSLTIESCQHIFCRECLRNFVENNSEPQIPCPIRDEGKCDGVLSDPEIKELVTDDVFQKYLSRSLTSALEADSQLTHCFFPGCSGICLIEDGLRRFYCPVCSKLNCLDCKTTHESPCKKRRRKVVEADEEGVIDLINDSEEDEGEEEEEGQIAMKLPTAETEAEAKLRKEWEASWEQLVAKFSTGKEEGGEVEGSGSEKKPFWKESVSHMEVFSELITTDNVFECPICFVDVEVGDGVILQECFHRFCRDCLAASIQHADEPRVKCPYQSGTYSCQMHILDKEIKSLVSDEVYDKLLKKSLSAAEMGMSNAFHCQSVNCTGWVEIDERVATFRCFICAKSNCVPCKAIHESLTCAEYQSRLREGECDVASKEELNRMISKGDAMRCPTCKVVIIKNGGCDGMTCVVCQTHICWATKGPRWGPKGRGDETGGCRCGFEGKKCHPKCGNCH